jgi:subtilisin family serine protease
MTGTAGGRAARALVLAALAVAWAIPIDAVPAAAAGRPGVHPSVGAWLADPENAAGSRLIWIFFRARENARLRPTAEDVRDRVSPRALARRARARRAPFVDEADLPLGEERVSTVAAAGAEIRVRSRWLNAVSVRCDREALRRVLTLPFIHAVRPVGGAPASERRLPGPGEADSHAAPPPRARLPHLHDYGPSLAQSALIHVPETHDLGYTGAGVVICMLDTGFDLDHPALTGVNVLAAFDFVNGDSVVANEEGDHPNQFKHGTAVLSTIAGYDPGWLVGPAFGAEYLLAKTETLDDEIPIEEDWWIAGIEWAEGLGADVASSSVGYTLWYTQDDLDGDTAPITAAADQAVRNGMVVVECAGNAGSSAWQKVIAPADGDSVIAAGSVGPDGVRSSFSSLGPTADGRIKPDLMTVGSSVVGVDAGTTGYRTDFSGTSFSAPQLAGVCALILEAHPDWTPMQVLTALRTTASQATTPDTLYGWGVVDAMAALTSTAVAATAPGPPPDGVAVLRASPNPANPRVEIRLEGSRSVTRVEVFDVTGRRVRSLALSPARAGVARAEWDGRDESGRPVASGIYLLRAGDAAAKLAVLR